MADDEDVLLKRVQESSAYFSSLLDLIPAKHYISKDALQGFDNFKGNEDAKPTKQLRKKLARNAKRLKLDPDSKKSIADLQREIEEQEQTDENPKLNNVLANPASGFVGSYLPSSELKEKLQSKIQQFQLKRKAGDDINDEGVKKKKRRSEKKIKKSEIKDKAKKKASVEVAVSTERNALSNEKTKKSNQSNDVAYSRLQFLNDTEAKKKRKVGKDIKNLLKKAEKKQERIQNIDDKNEAESAKSKQAWDNALKKADGEKIRDDPKLLKKSLKRKEKQKEKSAKQWSDRIETIKENKKEKQKLRVKHLKERRDSKGVKGKKANKEAAKSKKSKPASRKTRKSK